MSTLFHMALVLIILVLPATGLGADQWKLFEHRYPYQPGDVLQAAKFVPKKGYWEAYRDNKLAGYVFLSKDWTQKLVGYSGKHLETLIGMDLNGTITGTKMIFHSEPIVLIGLKEENYQNFIKQYAGKNIKTPLSVGREISMDAITGATVTAVVQNSIILESSRMVASEAGVMKAAKKQERKLSQKFTAMTWEELRQSGAFRNLVITAKELGIEGEDPYLDLYVAVVTPPAIGRNLLGDALYRDVMARMKGGESALAVFSKGKGSFKGTGFVRGGIFDRINIEQGAKLTHFNDKDYIVLSDIAAKGAPDINEGGVFIVRDRDFEPSASYRVNLVLPYRVGTKREFRSFHIDYQIPERFLD